MKDRRKLIIICPYPLDTAPSQRYRHELFLDYFMVNNVEIKVYPFLNHSTWNKLYNRAENISKILGVIDGFFRRIKLLFTLEKDAVILIHREATPLFFPWFEWFICKFRTNKVIYEFDDAIWMVKSETTPIINFIRNNKKVCKIIKWADLTITGNRFLFDFAHKFSNNVRLIPTVVDTSSAHNFCKHHTDNNQVIVGWTGTHSTLKYLMDIENALIKISSLKNIRIKIISNLDPQIKTFPYDFVKWNSENEIKELSTFDVGLMPLRDDDWCKGKCGFKAIQYMALGIPCILSPYGANVAIVENNETGFFAMSDSDWIDSIEKLSNNFSLRNSIALNARNKIVLNYSKIKWKKEYFSCFFDNM